MSEEILKALMQLFAILAKQDEGLSSNERDYVHTFLKQQLNESSVKEYLALFDNHIAKGKNKRKSIFSRDDDSSEKSDSNTNLTSVRDSVKTLGIAKKINKTLTQKQKVVVLVRLFELINSDKKFTPQRIAIIDTTADVFNISKSEYKSIESFVINASIEKINNADTLVINNGSEKCGEKCKSIQHEVSGNLIVLKINSVDLYFLRYDGNQEILLNGLPINNRSIYLFASGSVIKPPRGKPIFYSDVAAKYLADISSTKLSFTAKNVRYEFPNGHVGLHRVDFQEETGRLAAIMGASGAGKTTLLNVLSGIDKPTNGEVVLNGVNIHEDNEKLKGIIGYIPQDDLLIEELTVYENLYYNAKLVFKGMAEEEIQQRINTVLNNLGLAHIKELKVGNPLAKKISGGQRKRLNIGLELIREPSLLFVDEPTSGLSSRDSENVMELLRELTLKGKLIFVVIHQPSSDIFKMFDSVIILDTGGYQIYYGNPVESVIYFKTKDNQINSDIGECHTCGNVNPETIFNITEARIVDEYGKSTDKRKVSPEEWHENFQKTRSDENEDNTETTDPLPEPSKIPGWFKQLKIFFKRDLVSKLANKQYLAISLLVAPVISFVLVFILRYFPDPNSKEYIFRVNDNIMPYIFMCTIVALFLGLIVSAEEIFKDRKIRKRESFLNLSRSSYLFSKIGILFILTAIQSFLFIIIGNQMLGVKGMFFEYWLMFFSIAAAANVLGLNISSAFNSAVTIYILIPFLIIPQMVLTGAMFPFDKINKHMGGGKESVPIIADFMPSRWAFEGLIVQQFKNNEYTKKFYDLDKIASEANFKNVYLIPELKGFVENYKVKASINEPNPLTPDDYELLRNEISDEMILLDKFTFNYLDSLNPETFSSKVADSTLHYLNQIQQYYKKRFNLASRKKDNMITKMQSTPAGKKAYLDLYDQYYNDYLATFTKNSLAPKVMIRLNNRYIQKIDPIYLDPQNKSVYNLRSHFLAPRKNFFGKWVDTFTFNIIVLWVFTIIFYIALYYELLKKGMKLFEKKKSFPSFSLKAVFKNKKAKAGK